jgi:hypothetical protein
MYLGDPPKSAGSAGAVDAFGLVQHSIGAMCLHWHVMTSSSGIVQSAGI